MFFTRSQTYEYHQSIFLIVSKNLIFLSLSSVGINKKLISVPCNTGFDGPIRNLDDQFDAIVDHLPKIVTSLETAQVKVGEMFNDFEGSIWNYSPVIGSRPESIIRAQLMEKVIAIKRVLIEEKLKFTEEQVNRIQKIVSSVARYSEQAIDITSLRTKAALINYLRELANFSSNEPYTKFENEIESQCMTNYCGRDAEITVREKIPDTPPPSMNDDQEIRDPCSCGIKFRYCACHAAEVIFEISKEGQNYSNMMCVCGGILSLEDIVPINRSLAPPPAPRKRKIPREERITDTSLDGLTQKPVKSRRRLSFGKEIILPK